MPLQKQRYLSIGPPRFCVDLAHKEWMPRIASLHEPVVKVGSVRKTGQPIAWFASLYVGVG